MPEKTVVRRATLAEMNSRSCAALCPRPARYVVERGTGTDKTSFYYCEQHKPKGAE